MTIADLRNATVPPARMECPPACHVAANRALVHVLDRLAAEEELTAGDFHLVELLRHYLRAWDPAAVPCPRTSLTIRGTVLLLDRIHDEEELGHNDLSVVDTMLTACRSWGRELRAQLASAPTASEE